MTVKELLELLSFPDWRRVCVRLPSGDYAGGGYSDDMKRRFGDMHVLRGDILENAFIIYAAQQQ